MTMIIDGTNGLTFNNSTTQNSGGKVIQVVNAITTTETSSSTNTFVDSNLTATITPLFSTSKILVIVHQNGIEKAASNTGCTIRLVRNSTTLINLEAWAAGTNDTSLNVAGGSGCNYLDSPATTSATTYKTQFCSKDNSSVVYCQYGN